MGPVTQLRRCFTEATSGGPPSLGRIQPSTLLPTPLKIAELCGGLATGLEAFLKTGYAVASYTWVDAYLDAHVAVSHRLSRLKIQCPHLLPP